MVLAEFKCIYLQRAHEHGIIGDPQRNNNKRTRSRKCIIVPKCRWYVEISKCHSHEQSYLVVWLLSIVM